MTRRSTGLDYCSIASRRRVKLQGDIIRTKTFEYWVGTSAKMYACLQFLAERSDFDYLVRTNSSTYLHLPSMLEFLENAPRTRFYAGADQEQPHAQGTCIILSRDAVCSMSWDKSWDFHEVDDAAVGTAARRAGLTFVPVRQVVVESKAAASSFTQHNLRETFIFRMKTRGRRDEDIKALREVHRRLDDELGEN